ncbi:MULTISPECIES: amino acid ABC transporter substrate-binding protein [Aeribacillus]|jgi:L-cystine transport system substrate-binding protein|uniref:Amino acid ABC transporter substrate-binding protein n=1 Tax=Aeribacillus pallidus TaxID=33936 RepID=A0A223E4X6_9BACI|nr:amino acid ABC transporter substrate-binding protein [Aeribacillus pallidus]ASS90263.1 amino acid ABC transporter substrate-binding protein [Aeribacillus pallidus]MDR9793989.1 amino acid ABC transporter substrate-binding protein [Aeribacillus pallidus]
MKRKRIWTKFFLFILSIFVIAGCSNSESKETDDGKKVIKVALSDEVNPPFLYTDDQNKPIGYDMDYLAEIEKKLPEYKFEYTFGEEESNLIGVDTGKFDFAINWFFKNPEREQKFLYPEHEYGYSLTVLVTKSDRNDIKSLDDMVDKKLAPMAPSGGLRAILNGYNEKNPDNPIEIESMENPSAADNLKRVAEGKADAVFLNKTTFDALQKELKLDLKIGGIVSKEPVYIVYNKKHKELAEKIDKATAELIEDGTLPKLAEKWFGVDFFKDLDYIKKEGFQYEK